MLSVMGMFASVMDGHNNNVIYNPHEFFPIPYNLF